jgi:hypothetical protein
MRQKIDFVGMYVDARQTLPDKMDGQPPQPLPAVCPMTLDQLLSD